jgi:acyl dehydratase
VSAPQALSLADVSPGMGFGAAVHGPITRADIVRYAQASGDFNPVHTDERYARGTGAPTVFAMGMLPAGYLSHSLSDWIGGPHHIRRFKVRFVARVWPGDELVCTGRVEAIEEGLVRLTLQARRRGPGPEDADVAAEEPALEGEADVELPA